MLNTGPKSCRPTSPNACWMTSWRPRIARPWRLLPATDLSYSTAMEMKQIRLQASQPPAGQAESGEPTRCSDSKHPKHHLPGSRDRGMTKWLCSRSHKSKGNKHEGVNPWLGWPRLHFLFKTLLGREKNNKVEKESSGAPPLIQIYIAMAAPLRQGQRLASHQLGLWSL